jgi:hypothetical protein
MTTPVRTQEGHQGTAEVERRDGSPTATAGSARWMTVGSFACLGALAPWLVFCYVSVERSDPTEGIGAILLWLVIAVTGVCALTFVGAAFGVAATFGAGRKAGWAVLALGLNVLVIVVGCGRANRTTAPARRAPTGG